MNWNKIEKIIRDIVDDIKKECIIKNTAVRDDIFGILEDNCTVIYYPLENEKNRGFHIKRIVKDQLEDFVFINTAKPMAEQIFTAAHEFGHIFEVAQKVWVRMDCCAPLTGEQEEEITNQFAAELLMPADAFKKVFFSHMNEMGIKGSQMRLGDLIRIIVMLMNDFLVPYEAVRKRLVETHIVKPSVADILHSNEKEILELVEVLTKDQNTYLENRTGAKTISGVRRLIEEAEANENTDPYILKKLKKDLDIRDMSIAETRRIQIEGNVNG